MTTGEKQATELAAIRTFVTNVVRTERINRNVRQLTFGGGDLASFTPAAADQFLYLLAPPPGRDELTIDAGFTWEQYEAMAPEDQPIGAYYTVRRWRPEAAELDMVFVLHGHDGRPGGQAAHAVPMRVSERQRASGHQRPAWPGNAINGQAAAWAAGAGAGDPVALWGPRTAFHPPAATEWFLLVADDTGLPAVAAIIESLPDTTPILVVAEVDSEEDRQPVPAGANVEVRWCFRRGASAGGTTLLVDAVRALAWPPGTAYAWGGAESRCITAVRRHVRDERGLPRQAVSMTGYWRRD